MDYKKKIKERGLRQNWIAENVLKISPTLFCQYLNGGRPMPLHIEDKLKEL